MTSLHATLHSFRRLAATGLAAACLAGAALATTPLADGPAASNTSVPGNLAISLSVEFPTAVSVAHIGATYDKWGLGGGGVLPPAVPAPLLW